MKKVLRGDMDCINIDKIGLSPSHYQKGNPIRYTTHLGDIELIVWLDGYWKSFVRKTAFLRPIEKHEEPIIEEFRMAGIKACELLNKSRKKTLKLKRECTQY